METISICIHLRKIEKQNSVIIRNTTGIVEAVYGRDNISVSIKAPNGDGRMTIENASLSESSIGVNIPTPKIGDKVYIVFMNNSIYGAKITAVNSDNYSESKKSKGSGGYVVNTYPETEYIKSSVSYFDEENNDYSKYQKYKTQIIKYTDIVNSVNYSNDEIGIYHPNKNVTIKAKDDGSIDIFVNNNCGININPDSNSINLYGSIDSVGKNLKINFDNIEINANKTIKISGNQITIKEGDQNGI